MPEPVLSSKWDEPDAAALSVDDDRILEVIETADSCVLIRLRKDGHPVGAVVSHDVLDGEIYAVTNVFRAAHNALLRDPRCSAVFDKPNIASVTVIGRGEIVDDPGVLERFYGKYAKRRHFVTSGEFTEEEWLARAFTSNRRLVRVVPEKILSLDLAKFAKYR